MSRIEYIAPEVTSLDCQVEHGFGDSDTTGVDIGIGGWDTDGEDYGGDAE